MTRHGWIAGGAMAWGLALATPAEMLGTDHDALQPRDREQKLAMVLNIRQGEIARWKELQAARRPSRVAALAEAFRRDFPQSSHLDEARAIEIAATRVVALKREVGLTGDFFETIQGNEAFDVAILGAVRGDAEAAYRVARAYIDGKSGVFASMYRHEQWLRIAGELGHARASWELAQLYNSYGRVSDAAYFEQRAVGLGYKPPPRLPTRGY